MKTVLGVFPETSDANTAIAELRKSGFDPKDLSIVMKEGIQAVSQTNDTDTTIITDTTLSGAAAGGILGGITGLLIGIGAITVPGIGAVLIGGPLAAVLGLTGAAATTVSGVATGLLAGGLLGVLVGLGIPENDARIYEQHVKAGGILVAVDTTNEDASSAQKILSGNNAQQIRVLHAPIPQAEIYPHQ